MLFTQTPVELFRLAAKLRTGLKSSEIEDRINDVVHRLKLEKCKNTYIGGPFLKGLSGGEKKRASIGYELITNPALLLLDEPSIRNYLISNSSLYKWVGLTYSSQYNDDVKEVS